MSYFVPTVNIKSNPQESYEYAIYMIFASYFKKATCKNPIYESKLRFNYRETKAETQYKMEDFCERKAKTVFRTIPARIANSEVEVNFILREGYFTEIRFTGPDFVMRVSGSYNRGDYDLRVQVKPRIQ
jgi:hypothetical protein